MQLNNLDKKSFIELKDEIADLERRVEEVATIRVKADTPLEVLLEQSSYKEVWDETYLEAHDQAMDSLPESKQMSPFTKSRYLKEERLTYSTILESGKRYEQVGDGIVGLFALKIMDGAGLFDFMVVHSIRPFFTFTVIPGEKYVLLSRGVIFPHGGEFAVKEIEGHIRYVCVMSTFLNPKIVEVK
jgi:hypothetical protein